MKYGEVVENVKRLVENPPSHDDFIYELLLAYGSPKSGVTLVKKGTRNLAKEPGEVLWKKKVWFKPVGTAVPAVHGALGEHTLPKDLFAAIDEMKAAKATKSNDPRFLIVTDFEQLLAVDRKTGDTLDIDFQSLETNVDFFLPWAGMEKTKLSNENPADIKAAEKMAKLFDAIRQDNPDYMREDAHAMNVFLSRLLFCLFAEDTGIFEENAVCNAIASHTAVDGSDLDAFFKQLFDWLDTSDIQRKNREGFSRKAAKSAKQDQKEPSRLGVFARDNTPVRDMPYVNGGLFKDHFDIPTFSARARRMIIEAGTLNWSEINPDIFGSMFQAVIDPEERHNLGQHYTSVTNIMKVIEPLFLNDFKAELERARRMEVSKRKKGKQATKREKALFQLLDRIAKVKVFDPACGSGNFLIIAYKELRKLEMEVFKELESIQGGIPISGMNVCQFYGIEIDDFAHETAILALWLAEHQMNLEYKKMFGKTLVSLPLKEGANIECGNATRIDWETVCPRQTKPDSNNDEIYILGNPPYYGSSLQTKDQKGDMAHVFAGIKNYKNLDYIACWFFKAAHYIAGTSIRFSFVTTNSICQGEQVDMLWPHIFEKGLEIGFVHQSFLWSNNAKNKAAVSCVIIGIRPIENVEKYIYAGGVLRKVAHINPYLVASSTDLIIRKRRVPVSRIPLMTYGNKPTDGGHLILSSYEKDLLLADYPEAEAFVRKLMGAHEFTEGTTRWCLWITPDEEAKAIEIPPIKYRVNAVREMRASSKKKATRKLAETPCQFGEIRHKELNSILVPCHGSDRREYIPFGFLTADVVVTNSALVIYTNQVFVFGIITSRLHNVWIKATCGKIKEDPRYSSSLGYNNFPVPDLTEGQKQTITMHVGEVLTERENHSGKTMAQLYDPDKMPDGLRAAHHNLDLAVDRLYRTKPFTSDEERLEHLFKLYEEMIEEEKINNTPAKKLLKNRILTKLKSEQAYFSLAQIAEATAGLDLSERGLKNYMSGFAKEGIVFDAGRGWYSRLQGKLILPPEPVQPLVSLLRDRFPFLEFACWSTEQLNPFMHHMLSKFAILLYVERDAMESVTGALQEDGMTVYVNPGKQEQSRIVASKDPIVIIRPSIKKQPMDSSGYAQVEKVLVDFMIENGRFKWAETSEAERVVINAITAGRIDRGRLEMYKNERKLDWSADV